MTSSTITCPVCLEMRKAPHIHLLTLARQLLARIGLGLSVRRERQALKHLSPALLRDVGLTLEGADREIARAPWDLPTNR